MAIRIRIEEGAPAVFALAPLTETVLSLHALLYPQRHPVQHPWIREMRKLSPALKRELAAWEFLYTDSFPDLGLPGGGRQTFADQLAEVEAMPLERLTYELARPLYHYYEPSAGAPVRGRVECVAEEYGPDTLALAKLIFDDPPELRRRFLAMLTAYWEEAFAHEWARLEPELAAEADAGERELAEGDAFAWVSRLPQLRVDPKTRTVTRRSGHEHTVAASAERPLVLVPSAYAWPDVRVACDEPWPLAIVYPARFVARDGAARHAPPDLVAAFAAAGDDVRLRALKLIAERPRSTQELAPLLGLTDSGASKQVRRLVDAGLVRQRRQGWYVLHELDTERAAALSGELLAFLTGSGPTSS